MLMQNLRPYTHQEVDWIRSYSCNFKGKITGQLKTEFTYVISSLAFLEKRKKYFLFITGTEPHLEIHTLKLNESKFISSSLNQ